MDDETQARIDRMDDRLRQVLTLLVNAPVDTTTIPSSQGDIVGHNSFIGTDLRDLAFDLLEGWDEEDATPGAAP